MQRTVTAPDGTVKKKGSGATVVLRAYGVLAGILDTAVKDGRLAKTPARGVDNLPRKPKKKAGRRYLTHDEVDSLAAACLTAEKSRIIYTLAYTGMRWGELAGLRVRNNDLLRRRIALGENAVQVGTVIHVGTPKSHEQRTVPIPRFLVGQLAQQCEGKGRDDLLFPGDDGGHLKRSATQRGWFHHAVQRSGGPVVTPHDLRHTAASPSVQAGAHVLALSKMLGHASAAMTLDVCSDLFDSDLDAVADALDAARVATAAK